MENQRLMNLIGVMQGRLSPPFMDKIQSFPKDTWKEEFEAAQEIGLHGIEWTIDLENFEAHPLIDKKQEIAVNKLLSKYSFGINSVTCDYFMQGRPWEDSANFESMKTCLESLLNSQLIVEGTILVLPLVDLGSPVRETHWLELRKYLLSIRKSLESKNVFIAFEFDIVPEMQMEFVSTLGSPNFGINFDTGNSASNGFEPKSEISTIFPRLLNVHLKDRKLGGTTVPLGEGSTDFEVIFAELHQLNYSGNYILQCARGPSHMEKATILSYLDFLNSKGLEHEK
jgi:L-ribulose-5-phosphate 3-epimerase